MNVDLSFKKIHLSLVTKMTIHFHFSLILITKMNFLPTWTWYNVPLTRNYRQMSWVPSKFNNKDRAADIWFGLGWAGGGNKKWSLQSLFLAIFLFIVSRWIWRLLSLANCEVCSRCSWWFFCLLFHAEFWRLLRQQIVQAADSKR